MPKGVVIMRVFKLMAYAIFITFVSFLLTACLSGGGGGSSSGGSGTGQVSFAITDSPVSDAQNVVVSFDCLELQSANSGRRIFTFDPVKQIDLLQYQGNEFAQLISDELVPSGPYQWARLCVIAEQGNDQDSYIILKNGARYSLYVPSGDQSGLKINTNYYVEQDSSTAFTIDFDLHKSVNNPEGFPDYKLRPTLRLVKNDQVGSITGTVMQDACMGIGDNIENAAVYVFSGDVVIPDDLNTTDTTDIDPITTAMVKLDPMDSLYKYTAGFIDGSDGGQQYTVALTCQFSDDLPDQDNMILFDNTPINTTNPVTVNAGQGTTVDF